MEVIGREFASIFLELPCCGLGWFDSREHAALFGEFIGLLEVASRAGGDDIFPCCSASERARHDMIKGQILSLKFVTTILAGEAIAEEDIESGECGMAVLVDIVFESNDARQSHGEARRVDIAVIFGDDSDSSEEYGFDGILPAPERKRKIA